MENKKQGQQRKDGAEKLRDKKKKKKEVIPRGSCSHKSENYRPICRSGLAVTTRQESDNVAMPSTSSVSSGELRQLDIYIHAPESSKDGESDSDTEEH